ncbi:hypothetical protein [Priestia flexa]|uniref:hypothetical protein n=1 Tax=Priestia flexa TaxID=86664 RepID=UPI001CD7BE40|nr:hypothetical protein [Priestia flexa]MCA1203688.1 hypothetical protein [Priestia flexa]
MVEENEALQTNAYSYGLLTKRNWLMRAVTKIRKKFAAVKVREQSHIESMIFIQHIPSSFPFQSTILATNNHEAFTILYRYNSEQSIAHLIFKSKGAPFNLAPYHHYISQMETYHLSKQLIDKDEVMYEVELSSKNQKEMNELIEVLKKDYR